MNPILVAVGSRRAPKLNALSEALAVVGPELDPGARFEVVSVDVQSGVGHTPLGRKEIMAGARGRAEALLRLGRERVAAWRYFVGLEGGLDIVEEEGRRLAFLENWAYVCDRNGHGAYGYSGGILLPDPLAVQVLDHGTELSAAIDACAGGSGIRDVQGAWGVLTHNLITRQEVFRTAIINAFAPFFNVATYSLRDAPRGDDREQGAE